MRMSKRRTWTAVTVVAAVAVVGVGLAGVIVAGGFGSGPTSPAAANPTTSSSASVPAESTEGVEVDPSGETADPQSGQTVATDAPVTVTGQQAPVRVTYAEWDAAARSVVAGGLVGGVVETGGTCQLTLTRNGQSVSVDAPATPDAANTYCGEMSVPGSQLAAGTWQATVSYRSAAFTGVSPAVDVAVAP
jgi:hypothetical protein